MGAAEWTYVVLTFSQNLELLRLEVVSKKVAEGKHLNGSMDN